MNIFVIAAFGAIGWYYCAIPVGHGVKKAARAVNHALVKTVHKQPKKPVIEPQR